MADEKKQKCFVIMPFTVRKEDLERYHGDTKHWREVYHGLIVPAVEKAGLVCERDDEDSGSRLITENICRKLEEADVILCDLSASNPNVYLELGWALRADKKYVLIKDDVTPFNFDLNQCSTCEYSHMLQPTELIAASGKLSSALSATVKDEDQRYSIVHKLSISIGAIEAMKGGSVEAGLLGQVLQEIRALQSSMSAHMPAPMARDDSGPSIQTQGDLAAWLPGTFWIYRNDLRVINFDKNGTFGYLGPGGGEWEWHTYRLGGSLGHMALVWKDQERVTECSFFDGFSRFVDLEKPGEVWDIHAI